MVALAVTREARPAASDDARHRLDAGGSGDHDERRGPPAMNARYRVANFDRGSRSNAIVRGRAVVVRSVLPIGNQTSKTVP
jgi:hypothetical protein